MERRINFKEKGHDALTSLFGLSKYMSKSTIEKPLRELIYYRISQINGCAFCLDMHSKDLLSEGETEQRLLVLDAWREAPFYTDRERAALGWAEAVNKREVHDDVYEEVQKHFTEKEIIDLTMAVITINGYNMANISFKTPAGTYAPGQFTVQINRN